MLGAYLLLQAGIPWRPNNMPCTCTHISPYDGLYYAIGCNAWRTDMVPSRITTRRLYTPSSPSRAGVHQSAMSLIRPRMQSPYFLVALVWLWLFHILLLLGDSLAPPSGIILCRCRWSSASARRLFSLPDRKSKAYFYWLGAIRAKT